MKETHLSSVARHPKHPSVLEELLEVVVLVDKVVKVGQTGTEEGGREGALGREGERE